MAEESVRQLGIDQLSSFLRERGIIEEIIQKFRDEEIDGESLFLLEHSDLVEIFPKAGPRARFRAFLDSLKIEKGNSVSTVLPTSEIGFMPSPKPEMTATPITVTSNQSAPVTVTAANYTVQSILGAAGTIEKMADRYHLRVHGIKVYEEEFVKAQPPVRQKLYQFRNEESLKLVKENKQKKLIDGIVLTNWRLWGRNKALQDLSATKVSSADKDPFEKYNSKYKKITREISEIDDLIELKELEKVDRMKKGHLDPQSKRNNNELIDSHKQRRTLLMSEIDTVGKNWDTALRKYIRDGPPKKRGRKSKTAIVFKCARDLKRKRDVLELDSDEEEYDTLDECGVVKGEQEIIFEGPSTSFVKPNSREINQDQITKVATPSQCEETIQNSTEVPTRSEGMIEDNTEVPTLKSGGMIEDSSDVRCDPHEGEATVLI